MSENLTNSNTQQNTAQQDMSAGLQLSSDAQAYALKSSADKLKDYAIPQDLFETPTMGDFYLGDVDDMYLRKIDAVLHGKANAPEEADANDGNGKKAVFYTEAPSFTNPGTDGKNHFFFKVSTDSDGYVGNWHNGETVRVRLDNLKTEANNTAVATAYRDNIKSVTTPCEKMQDDDYIMVNLYGIVCPKAARLAFESDVPLDKVDFKEFSKKDIENNSSSFVYSSSLYDGGVYRFVKLGNKYHEAIMLNSDDQKCSFKWVVLPAIGDGNPEAGTALTSRLTHDDFYIMLDGTNSDPPQELKNMANDSGIVNTLKTWGDESPNCGYRLLRQAYAGSLSGSAYAKIDGKWVNIAKAVIADKEKTGAGVDKDFTGGTDNTTFKANYDEDNTKVADDYFTTWEELDDRKIIQKKILGKNWSELKDWTVTIGDVTLMVPPTSIVVQSSTVNDSIPILRARGSMPVGAKYDLRTLQIPIYFCDDNGINGYRLKEKAPNGTEMEYSINGLRALISQFHFTPFLPIDNTYLNDVIGIKAVTFDTININTVPGMPQLIQANLYMREFNYEAYIPEVALLGLQRGISNPFSAAFNWKTMRYYYQRALMAGDKLRKIGYDINSKEYINAALECRTALQPMRFEDNSMKFYIADADYLDKMLASKKARQRKMDYAVKFSESSQKALKNVGELGQVVKKVLYSKETKEKLEDLQDLKLRADMNVKNPVEYGAGNYATSDYCVPQNFGIKTADGKDAGEQILALCGSLREQLNSVSCVEETKIYHHKDEAKNKITVGVAVRLKTNIDDDTLDNLRQNLAPLISISDSDKDTLLENGWIKIPFNVYADADKNAKLSIDSDCPDVRALDYALSELKNTPRTGGTGTGEAQTDDWMKAPLMAQLDSMRYKPINTGTFFITSVSAAMRNTFSNVHLQGSGKSCAQFLGGQDTEINVSIQTTDLTAVKMIENLPDLATMLMRKYRQIIPCFPIKVDSEITRFLGVSEVMLDNVTVSTVPNHPGVYSITINMKSMDRTIRSRESTEMIQANNGGYRNSSYFDDMADFIKGKDRVNTYQKKSMKSYFDIQNTISHAELYPDLELPTLSEMNALGYEFVRYKFQDSRTYVDPDFYFVYLTRLSSQLLRETILNSVQAGIDGTKTITDSSGAKYKVSPVEQKGFDLIAQNDEAKRQTEVIKSVNDAQYELNAKQTPENLRDKSRDRVAAEDYETWDVSNDIKVLFMEERYKKEIESYDARQKADKAKAHFEQPEETADATDDNSQVQSTDNTSQVQATDDSSQVQATDDTSQVQAVGTDKVAPEGAWVVQQLANADAAVEKIEKYLKDTPIPLPAPKENVYRNSFLSKKKADADLTPCYNSVKEDIMAGVQAFLSTAEVIEIFDLLDIERSSDFISITKDIIFAAACAASAPKEYSAKKKATDWMPEPDYMGIKVPVGTQNISAAASAESFPEALEQANYFGAFNIRQYTASEFLNITGENPTDVWSDEEKNISPINTSRYLLDRYYRYQPLDTIRLYKQGCVNSPKFCTFAYMRNMLYWLRRLLIKRVLPSINGDVLRKTAKVEQDIQKTQKENDIPASQSDAELRDHMAFFTKNAYAVDAGKMWLCSMLALSDGSKLLRDRVNNRDYRGLNEYLHGVSVASTPVSPEDKLSSGMRKSNLALAGLGRQENKIASGVRSDAPSNRKIQQMDNQLYIKAADDPKTYMMHSCHDMIVYDARGRMLRAFPTYYMMLIDEGRELGSYKLHDNFYNSTNILSFDVVKDRKNPADTANIVLTNVYQSENSEEDTSLRARESSNWDAFRSIFSPSTLGEDEEARRTKESGTLDKLNLRAGARIHLRAGYGSNAAMLPIIFNGSIAEINSESTINIVAQGDGVELTNPIMEEMEAQDIDQHANWLTNGDTPKDIINMMLTTSGGWMSRLLKNCGRPDLLGDNPYGIYHFGNKDFKDIVASGEPTQNVFDALPTPVWDEESDGGIILDQAPSISFDVFGKSPWDVINICRSVMPDFIASVAPFDFRSTIFVGAPRYYYAYSYMQTNGGVIREKRKPFQQLHIYSSASDIIANGITATSQKMKTTATGLYQVAAAANTKEQHKVGPLYADADIYPENQKSMIVDTQLFAKGAPIIGYLTNVVTSFEMVDELIGNDNKPGTFTGGHNMSAKGIAWRMTASALKDSMKEMYAGDMIILGDTSVKPHDRISIADTYTGISGQCTAKEVVHHMSLENGFITTISPDCINTVQDTFEPIINSFTKAITTSNVIHTLTLANFLRAIATRATPASEAAAIKNLGSKIFQNKIDELNGLAAKNARAAKALEAIKKMGGKATHLTGSAAKKMAAKLGARIATHATVGSVGGLPGIAVAVTLAVAETAVIETIGSLITNKLKKCARDLQVITVYPLKRYGRAWVAGVSGSKGMIYGTPSFKDNGMYTKILNKISGIETPNSEAEGEDLGYDNQDPSMGIANFTAVLLDDPETWNIAKNSASQVSGNSTTNGDPTLTQNDFDNTLRASFSSPNAGTEIKNDYRSMQMTPRVNFSSGNEALLAYKNYAILDTDNYLSDPKLKNLYLISSDNRLRPYTEEGFFKIIHETPALNEGAFVDAKILKIRGEQKYVKVIQYKLDNGDIVYDIPMLTRDALNILYEIIRRAKNYMPAANSSDPYESYEETKSSFIALESALRVGDTQSLAAAGFTFILQGVDNAVTPLAAAIKDLQDEIKSDAEKNGLGEEALFDSSVDETDKTKIAIVVRMPKVFPKDKENEETHDTDDLQ